MALVEDIAERGLGAVLEDAQDTDATFRELVYWLTGEQLSERADEPELRVATAWEARELFDGIGLFDRLAAQSILALPPDHDERDPGRARELLEHHRQESRDEGDAEEELRTISALLSTGLVDEQEGEVLLARGAAIADSEQDPGGAESFLLEAHGYCVNLYIDARDDGDTATASG